MKKSLRLKSNNYRIVYISLAFTIFVFTVSALYLSTEKAKKRENFWVATKSIPLGQLIKESDVELQPFDLANIASQYLLEEQSPIGLFTKQIINKNELISQINVSKSTNYRNVSLKIPNGHLPPNLKENDEVDVWFSDPLTNTSTLLISKISIVWVDELNTNFGGVSTVVVAIPQDMVATLIKSSRTEGLDLVQIEN